MEDVVHATYPLQIEFLTAGCFASAILSGKMTFDQGEICAIDPVVSCKFGPFLPFSFKLEREGPFLGDVYIFVEKGGTGHIANGVCLFGYNFGLV